MNNLRFHVWLFRKVVSRLDVELLKSFVVDCHRLFTIDGYRRHIEICAATARYKNTQLVLSIGNHIDKERIGPLPKNAIVVKNAPQLELLKRAALCITHAGCNTVLESLWYGVPQIAIPIAHDQPGVASRIVENGTGRYMPLENLTAKGLATLIDEVLSNGAYLESVRKLQKSIAQGNGLSAAANLLEKAFGLNGFTDSAPLLPSAQPK